MEVELGIGFWRRASVEHYCDFSFRWIITFRADFATLPMQLDWIVALRFRTVVLDVFTVHLPLHFPAAAL